MDSVGFVRIANSRVWNGSMSPRLKALIEVDWTALTIQYSKCSSAQSTKTWPTVH